MWPNPFLIILNWPIKEVLGGGVIFLFHPFIYTPYLWEVLKFLQKQQPHTIPNLILPSLYTLSVSEPVSGWVIDSFRMEIAIASTELASF